jgi:hypothetical protein
MLPVVQTQSFIERGARRRSRGPAGGVRLLLLVLLLCGCLPAVAGASQTVRLHTTFSPDRPGVSTTITFGFEIFPTGGALVPSPVTHLNLHLPAGMHLGASTLGLSTCEPTTLIKLGLSACPAEAVIGLGSATVEVPYGPTVVEESANVATLLGPSQEHLEVLFYTEGARPIFAALVFPARVLSESGPFSGSIDTAVPLIPTLPGAPDVSLGSFQSTIGPRGIYYYRRIHGKFVRYRPKGILVPRQCPRGGFPFAAEFSFHDGTTTTAKSTVPCPPHTTAAR